MKYKNELIASVGFALGGLLMCKNTLLDTLSVWWAVTFLLGVACFSFSYYHYGLYAIEKYKKAKFKW